MSTTPMPDQGTADELPSGRLRRGTSVSVGRLGDTPVVWLFALALALAAVAVVVTLILPLPAYEGGHLPWPLFALAFGLANMGVLHVSVRSRAATIALAEIPLVIGFFLAVPSELVLANLVGATFALAVIRRLEPVRLAFNLALSSLASALAIVVFRVLAPAGLDDVLAGWLASLAGASTLTLIGAPAVVLMLSIRPRRLQPGLGARVLVGVLAAAVNTSLALIAVEFVLVNPRDLWLVPAPAAVALLGYRALIAHRQREARIRFLYDCAGILARRSTTTDPLLEMLSLARDEFGADVAEIVVGPGGGRRGPTRTSVGPGSAVEAATPIDAGQFAATMASLPPAGARRPDPGGFRAIAARLAARRRIDEITVPLRVDDETVGVLRVAGHAAHRDSFGSEDMRLLEALGLHTGVALRNSGLLASLAESLANVTQLAAAVAASDDAILAVAPDATITAWNPGAERLFGYAGDEIDGMPATGLIPPERREETQAWLAGFADGHAPRHGRTEVVRKDGIRVPVLATISPITDPAGTAVGYSVIAHDVSAREAAEAALREREEQFRNMFEHGPIGMALVDGHRRWTVGNEALCRLLERRPDEVIGRPSDAFVHPDDVAAAREQEAALFTGPGEAGYSIRRRYLTPAGRTIWARVTERSLWSATMGPGSTICMIEDITESHLASERARETEARLHRAVAAFTSVREPEGVLRAVLAAARDLLQAEYAAIGVLSTEGSEFVDLQFDGVGDDTVAAVGRLPLGCGVLGLAGPGTGAVRVRDVASHPATRGLPAGHPSITSFIAVPIVFEDRLVARLYAANKRDDSEFDADDESVATALAAQAAVVIENARINARTLALVEELDRANEELRRANDARSLFLGTVSHELRTPLHSILVAAQLVNDPVFGQLNEARARDLGATIQGSARHLLELIDDLVDLSRIEARRADIHPARLSVSSLLEEVREAIQPIARERGVTLHVGCETDLTVEADPLRIRQVLVNLLSNAVKFTGPDGTASIDARLDAGSVQIRVSDTGPGMPPEDLERIFEPFERLGRIQTPGAGLGLAIARRLVDLHGGRLEVASTVGSGSTFTVALPHRPPTHPLVDPGAEAESALPDDRPAGTILVVEDDGTALELVTDVLTRTGFTVWGARDLGEASGRIARELPSLVLLDLRLGAEDGLDLVRSIRADPRSQHLPIMALSADAMDSDVARALEAGCDEHMAKPVVTRELVRRIVRLLGLGPAGNPANGSSGRGEPGQPTPGRAATSAGGRGA